MNKIPENRRRAILEAHRNKCVYCDQYVLLKNLHIDHILPKSLAADSIRFKQVLQDYGLPLSFDINGLSNLVPVCAGCNLEKKNHISAPTVLNYQIENARRLANKVMALEAKFNDEDAIGRSLSQIMSLSEKGLFPPTEIKTLFKNLEGVTEYQLFHKLMFANGNTFEKITKNDIPSLLSLTVVHGSEEEGLELANDFGNKRRVYSCGDWIKAHEEGFFPYTTYAIKMGSWFLTVESIVNALQKAKQPTKSFITHENVGICSLDLIPAELLPAHEEGLVEEDKYRKFAIESGKSFQDIINDGEASIRWIKPFGICIEYNGFGFMFREIFRADLNNDGIEDILLEGYTFSIDGTFGAPHSLTVFRDSPTSFFKVCPSC
jgi:5-methylcytosine-specific restriction endonuclease McrA